MLFSFLFLFSLVCLSASPFASAAACSHGSDSLLRTNFIPLSPTKWPSNWLSAGASLENSFNQSHPLASSNTSVLTGASEALASVAGQFCLQQGGNAIDCALTTVFSQIVLSGGSYVSFAGIMVGILYDSTAQSYQSLNAFWNSVMEDTDPASFSCSNTPLNQQGRAILVPGFFAGAKQLADCYGSLPWANLFDPAIYFTQGFNMTKQLSKLITMNAATLKSTSQGQQLYFKSNGEPYQPGDWFVQSDLQGLLQTIAQHGPAAAFYSGPFAKQYLSTVQSAGSLMTMTDLQSYVATWDVTPTVYTHINTKGRKFSIQSRGSSAYAALDQALRMNLIQVFQSNVLSLNWLHYQRDATALQFLNWANSYASLIIPITVLSTSNQITALNTRFLSICNQTIDFTPSMDGLGSLQHAETIYKVYSDPSGTGSGMLMYFFGPLFPKKPSPGNQQNTFTPPEHSSAVVASDQQGNIIALTHSINSKPFGTGLIVSGIPLSNALCSNQAIVVHQSAPGTRIPDNIPSEIVMDPTVPGNVNWVVLAHSLIGTGLSVSAFLRKVLAVNADGQNGNPYWDASQLAVVPELLYTPLSTVYACPNGGILGCHFPINGSVRAGDFSDDVLSAVALSGVGMNALPNSEALLNMGFWVGLRQDGHEYGSKTAGVTKYLNGLAVPSQPFEPNSGSPIVLPLNEEIQLA